METAIILVLLASASALFVTEKLPVDVVSFLLLSTIVLTGVIGVAGGWVEQSKWISLEESVSGFANSAVITVACMFVISAALDKAGLLSLAGGFLARIGTRPVVLLAALMIVVAGLSAFLNNTATVAILLPVVLTLCRQGKLSPSKYLMPLSFAAQFGGVCTLIGTSSNLLISSLGAQRGLEPLRMFEMTPLGVILAATGVVYFMVLGRWLLPERTPSAAGELENLGPYVSELRITENSPLNENTIYQNRESFEDVNVLELVRGKRKVLSPRHETLREDDMLIVQAEPERLMSLREQLKLEIVPEFKFNEEAVGKEEVTVVEAMVAPRSSLAGRSLAQLRFSSRYDAAVLAVRRDGATVRGKLKSVRLKPGDLLLVLTRKDNLDWLRQNGNLLVLQELGPVRRDPLRMAVTVGITVAMVALAALNLMPILAAALLAVSAILLTRCLTVEEAYQAVDWKIVMMLAALIPLGLVMERSGAAGLAAQSTLSLLHGHQPVVYLAVVYLVTLVLTELMSNSATVMLMTPIALSTAAAAGVSGKPFLMAVCFATSVNFATPIGYQTNLMVYGPAGYKFSDFLRVGGLLDLIFAILCIGLIPVFWPFG